MTSCINKGKSSQFNGMLWLPLALLELLVCGFDMSRLFCTASISPTTMQPCGSATSKWLFCHSCLIKRKLEKAFYLSQHCHLVGAIMRTYHYACANSVLNAQPRHGFPTVTLFNVLDIIISCLCWFSFLLVDLHLVAIFLLV